MVNMHIIIEFFCSIPQNGMVNISLTQEIPIAMSDITKIGTDTAKESLIPAADESSGQILRTIDAVEEHLRTKRSRIEELQTRHDDLVEELKQLDKSLESEGIDFVSSLRTVIDDLDAGATVVTPAGSSTAAEPSNSNAKVAAPRKPAQKSAREKPARRSSLRWLKDKDRSRRDDKEQLIPDGED